MPRVRRRSVQRSQVVAPLEEHPWDALRALLSKDQRAIALDGMELAARIRSYAEREGLTTLGELAERSAAELSAAGNFGSKSLTAFVQAVTADQGHVERDHALFERGLLESFEALLAPLFARERAILLGRAGLYNGSASLERLGDELGLTKERIRQIEAIQCSALSRRRGWAYPTRARIESALAEGAVEIAVLRKDPWWARACRYPSFIEFVATMFFDIEAHVVELNGVLFLSRWRMTRIRRAAMDLRREVLALPTPAPRASIDALVRKVPREILEEKLEAQMGADFSRLWQVFARPDFVRFPDGRIGLSSWDTRKTSQASRSRSKR